jgi:hypothetical protein
VRDFRFDHPDQRHANDLSSRHAIGYLAIDTGWAVAGDLASARPEGGRLGCRR